MIGAITETCECVLVLKKTAALGLAVVDEPITGKSIMPESPVIQSHNCGCEIRRDSRLTALTEVRELDGRSPPVVGSVFIVSRTHAPTAAGNLCSKKAAICL